MASIPFLTSLSWPWLLAILLSIPLSILVHDIILWQRMPPGPRPLPFIGNKHQIPKSAPWIQFEQWSKQYGPIFTLWIGRRPTIIISDPNIAVDLMEKRSHVYSSRPRFVVMGEIYSDMSSVLVQPYGKAWSLRRKLLHHALTPSALRLYKPIQEAEASRLCAQLLADPGRWEMLLDRFTSGIVFAVAYGHRIDSMDSAIIRQRLAFMHYQAQLNVPGAFLAETFPVLARLPDVLVPSVAEVKRRGRIEAAANMALVEDVQRELAQAKQTGQDIPDSLCKLLLQMREKEDIPLSARDFAAVPASLFGAGEDTTASTLCSAFLALVTHPETLTAAHAELDAVIGPDRTPTFADEPSLPYIRALCKEVLRWRPVAVLGGTPHASTERDVYRGYVIPAGTTILGNSWAINLNPLYYPNPHHFNPLRFLSSPSEAPLTPTHPSPPSPAAMEKGSIPHPSAQRGHSSFGWGRRICPGAGLAENSLFVALAKLLWGFEIRGMEGRVYDTFDYTEGFNIRPRSFECVVRPRSERHREVLLRENERAEAVMSRFTPFREVV